MSRRTKSPEKSQNLGMKRQGRGPMPKDKRVAILKHGPRLFPSSSMERWGLCSLILNVGGPMTAVTHTVQWKWHCVTSMLDQEASFLFAKAFLLDPWATAGYSEVTILWGNPSMWEAMCGPPPVGVIPDQAPADVSEEPPGDSGLQMSPPATCLPSWAPRHHGGDINHSHNALLYLKNLWAP